MWPDTLAFTWLQQDLKFHFFFFDLYIKAIFFFFFFLVRIDFGWFYSVSESKYDLYFNVVLKSIVPYCEVDYEWHEYIVYVLNSPYFYFSSWICCCACSVSVETYAFLRPASTPAVLNIFLHVAFLRRPTQQEVEYQNKFPFHSLWRRLTGFSRHCSVYKGVFGVDLLGFWRTSGSIPLLMGLI